jgi:hypothetical protein
MEATPNFWQYVWRFGDYVLAGKSTIGASG